MIQLSIEFYDRENWFYFKMLWIIFPPAFNFGERVHEYVNPDKAKLYLFSSFSLQLFIFYFFLNFLKGTFFS